MLMFALRFLLVFLNNRVYNTLSLDFFNLIFDALTPLSAIFQLYHGDQF
jgi:hypothetical protein